MEPLTIALIVSFLLLVTLFGIGLKFPSGSKDWPLDRKTTAGIFFSILIFILLMILTFFAFQYLELPENVVVFYYVSIIIFVVLMIIAILLPRGFGGDDGT